MSFTRAKPSGWAFGEVLTSAQMNALDTDHAAAVDGGAGGDYIPTPNPIRIKGKGFSVGTAVGDDSFFSTVNAKFAAAAIDLTGGNTIGGKLVDLCDYRDGALLAVGSNAADKIFQSLDDGFSWRDISSHIASPQTITLQCCAAKAATVLAAGNSDKIYASGDDAATWTTATPGGSPNQFRKLLYNPTLDLFIAVGATASAPYLASITSSLVPVQRTVPASITGAVQANSIAMASGGAHAARMVATWNAQTKVAFSDNGTTWSASTTSLTSSDYLVAYGDGVFVALSALGSNTLAYVSTDGDTWTTSGVTKPTSNSLASFDCLNGVFLAKEGASNNMWVSTNKGATWHLMSCQYLQYSTISNVRVVSRRVHVLMSDGSNSIDMRGRRLGFGDGTD